MPVSASLPTARVEVAPGGSATVELTVRNTGSVVDEMRIEVLGPASGWITPSPATVPLFPGASAPVILTIAPPRRSDIPAGELDVAVKVVSREDPDGSSVEELVVMVAAFDAPDAELIPRTSRGGRKATVQIAIDNHGNRRTQRVVTAFDSDQLLRFEAEPPSVNIEAGNAEFAQLRIKPVKTFLRGTEKTVPYKVRLDDGDSSIVLDGTFVQTPLLPRWLLRLLGLLLLALIALLVLWQVAFKPVINSAARNAATKQVDQAADKAATDAAQAVAKAAGLPTDGGGGGGGAPTTTAGGGGGAPTTTAGGGGGGSGGGGGDDGKGGASMDKRLTVEAASGATARSDDWAPGGEKGRFSLTDVVLQNPNGDAGSLRVLRGDDVLFESALENFRDLDFHFVAPYIVQGVPLRIEVTCRNVAGGQPCKPAVSFAGFLGPAPPEAPAEAPDTTVAG